MIIRYSDPQGGFRVQRAEVRGLGFRVLGFRV